jgi:hypothetical protein
MMATDKIETDEIKIIDQRGLGPIEHGRKLPEIITEKPAHGSFKNPVVVVEHGPEIKLEEDRA